MNTPKNKKIELGKELAAQRESKGLTVQNLSDITKISKVNIENLEKGVMDFLPSAYVKAYLISISRELGFDPNVVLKKYNESFFKDVEDNVITPVAKPQKPGPVVVPEKPNGPEETEVAPGPIEEKGPGPVPEIKGPDAEVEKGPIPEPEKIGPEPAEEKPLPGPKEQGPKDPIEEELGPETVKEGPEADPETAKPGSPEEKKPEPVKPVAESKPMYKEAPPKPGPVHKPEPVIQPQAMPKSNWFQDLKLMMGFYSVFIYGFLFIVALLIAGYIFLWPRLHSTKAVDAPPATVITQDSTATAATDSAQSAQSLLPIKLTLKMSVTDSTWLRIVYDNGAADEGIFAPGDERTWESDSLFWMRIGNAQGVSLFLDGKDLGQVGNPGQITNIVIDKAGAKTIRKYEFPKAMGIEGL